MTLTGRIEANGAELDSLAAAASATASGESARANVESAIAGYGEAEARDPLNPDYPMKLAGLLESMGQKDAAEAAARRAIGRAATGKTYYRCGRLLSRNGKLAEASKAYENARKIEPNNLDNLLALAEMYVATNRNDEAIAIWRRIVDLYHSDFARIRAVPEMIEWQYGRAFQMLGQGELERGDTVSAVEHLKEAVSILGLFWKQRDLLIAQIRVRPDDRRRTAAYYSDSLATYAKALAAAGKSADAAAATQQQLDFQREREDFEGKTGPSVNSG